MPSDIDSLFDGWLDLAPREAVLVLFSVENTAQAIRLAARAEREGHTITPVAAGSPDTSYMGRVNEALDRLERAGSRVTLVTLEHDLIEGLDELILACAGRTCPVSVSRVTGCRPEPFDGWALPSRGIVAKTNRDLARRLNALPEVDLETAGGARLRVSRPPAGDGWRSSPDDVLPPGGVFAVDPVLDGVFVADGAITVNRPIAFDVRLAASPATLVVKDSRVVDLDCPDPRVAKLLSRALAFGDCGVAGSVEVNANHGAGPFVPDNGLINRRRPGFLLSLGHRPRIGTPRHSAGLHIDLASAFGRVLTDDWVFDTRMSTR
ncbi:hypothetical protein [Microbispora sp. ATCC PTA-5024]|uniref:hypothetical protein n=1 Tax=Microbispora sp. ATCC PTA-5024 TaxID=316330 RepID=UPI0003DC4B36|nr:hypothetical protein [Microbispora sp. ATCC PTA-5024]ETK37757.1 hypothetical protein MPTA5024_02155 [Microbispora sp. ATCC PTA-5024]